MIPTLIGLEAWAARRPYKFMMMRNTCGWTVATHSSIVNVVNGGPVRVLPGTAPRTRFRDRHASRCFAASPPQCHFSSPSTSWHARHSRLPTNQSSSKASLIPNIHHSCSGRFDGRKSFTVIIHHQSGQGYCGFWSAKPTRWYCRLLFLTQWCRSRHRHHRYHCCHIGLLFLDGGVCVRSDTVCFVGRSMEQDGRR